MNEELKPVWDRVFSRTNDYQKAVNEMIDRFVYPEDKKNVRYVMTFEKYKDLMKNRRSLTVYFQYRKDEEHENYLYEKLSINKLNNIDDDGETLVFSCVDVDDEIREKFKEMEEKKQQYSVSYALGREYSSIYYVDLESGNVTPYNLSNRIEGMFGDKFYKLNYDNAAEEYIEKAVAEKDKEMMRKVLSRKFILSQVAGQDYFIWIYQNNEGSFCEMKCVKVSEPGDPVSVVMGFAVKDAQIRIEMEEKAQTDFQLSLLDGLSRDYEMVWLLRKDRKMRLFRVCDNPEVQRVALQYYDSSNFDLGFSSFIDRYVSEDDKERLKEFVKYDTLITKVPPEGMYSTIFKRMISKDEFVYLQLCFTRAIGPDGEENIVVACRDVDALIREENERREQYRTAIKERDLDGLTGIRNRYCYENYLKKLAKEEHDSISVIYIDADFLHELNNTKGHDAGDALIKHIASSIIKVWGLDNSFRIGGDEFVVFDFDKDRRLCMEKIDSLRKSIKEKQYSVSIGYSHTEGKCDLPALISASEKMMYEEKKKHHENVGEVR